MNSAGPTPSPGPADVPAAEPPAVGLPTVEPPPAVGPDPARPGGVRTPGVGPLADVGQVGRTSPRTRDRRTAAPLAKVGMLLFALGVVAIFADFILFAAGSRDLPLWLNLTAMLAPVGLGLGLVGVVQENRNASPALAARRAPAPE